MRMALSTTSPMTTAARAASGALLFAGATPTVVAEAEAATTTTIRSVWRRSQTSGACSLAAALLVGVLLVSGASAYPSGAPEQACKELKPGHGAEPQSGTAPFELTQDKLQVGAGDQIKVTLGSANKTTFKGLLVQALNEKGEPFGKFLAGKGLKTLDSCSAVTHSDRESKKTASLVWEAPADMKVKEPVVFKATVVHKFDQFYMNIKSTLAT